MHQKGSQGTHHSQSQDYSPARHWFEHLTVGALVCAAWMALEGTLHAQTASPQDRPGRSAPERPGRFTEEAFRLAVAELKTKDETARKHAITVLTENYNQLSPKQRNGLFHGLVCRHSKIRSDIREIFLAIPPQVFFRDLENYLSREYALTEEQIKFLAECSAAAAESRAETLLETDHVKYVDSISDDLDVTSFKQYLTKKFAHAGSTTELQEACESFQSFVAGINQIASKYGVLFTSRSPYETSDEVEAIVEGYVSALVNHNRSGVILYTNYLDALVDYTKWGKRLSFGGRQPVSDESVADRAKLLMDFTSKYQFLEGRSIAINELLARLPIYNRYLVALTPHQIATRDADSAKSTIDLAEAMVTIEKLTRMPWGRAANLPKDDTFIQCFINAYKDENGLLAKRVAAVVCVNAQTENYDRQASGWSSELEREMLSACNEATSDAEFASVVTLYKAVARIRMAGLAETDPLFPMAKIRHQLDGTSDDSKADELKGLTELGNIIRILAEAGLDFRKPSTRTLVSYAEETIESNDKMSLTAIKNFTQWMWRRMEGFRSGRDDASELKSEFGTRADEFLQKQGREIEQSEDKPREPAPKKKHRERGGRQMWA